MIPIWICMALYWIYCQITGKEQEPEQQKEEKELLERTAEGASGGTE